MQIIEKLSILATDPLLELCDFGNTNAHLDNIILLSTLIDANRVRVSYKVQK